MYPFVAGSKRCFDSKKLFSSERLFILLFNFSILLLSLSNFTFSVLDRINSPVFLISGIISVKYLFINCFANGFVDFDNTSYKPDSLIKIVFF